MKNTERLPERILTALREYYDDETIDILKPKEIFEMWCNYEGYIHCNYHILNAIDSIFGTNLSD